MMSAAAASARLRAAGAAATARGRLSSSLGSERAARASFDPTSAAAAAAASPPPPPLVASAPRAATATATTTARSAPPPTPRGGLAPFGPLAAPPRPSGFLRPLRVRALSSAASGDGGGDGGGEPSKPPAEEEGGSAVGEEGGASSEEEGGARGREKGGAEEGGGEEAAAATGGGPRASGPYGLHRPARPPPSPRQRRRFPPRRAGDRRGSGDASSEDNNGVGSSSQAVAAGAVAEAADGGRGGEAGRRQWRDDGRPHRGRRDGRNYRRPHHQTGSHDFDDDDRWGGGAEGPWYGGSESRWSKRPHEDWGRRARFGGGGDDPSLPVWRRRPGERAHPGAELREEQQQQPQPQSAFENALPATPWALVSNIPPLSSLRDILDEVGRAVSIELGRGIVDLDAAERMIAEEEERERVRESAESWGVEERDVVGHDGTGGDGDEPPSEEEAAAESKHAADFELPLWDLDSYVPPDGEPFEPLPPHLVLEARLRLSALGRPCGWYLRFPDRSVVHALVSHAAEGGSGSGSGSGVGGWRRGGGSGPAAEGRTGSESSSRDEVGFRGAGGGLSIGTNVLTAEPFDPSLAADGGGAGAPRNGGLLSFSKSVELDISDSVLRVENCPRAVTVDQVRYVFRHFDLADERELRRRLGPRRGRAVTMLLGPPDGRRLRDDRDEPLVPSSPAPLRTKTFLVRFESAAEARSALRTLQHAEMKEGRVRLAMYPRQMLPPTPEQFPDGDGSESAAATDGNAERERGVV